MIIGYTSFLHDYLQQARLP